MRRSKFSESQRLAILAEQDGGKSVEEICRKHQVSPATLYKWKQALAIQLTTALMLNNKISLSG